MGYAMFENKNKLQRAIEQVKREQQPASKKEARIRELYISYGGRISLEDLQVDNKTKTSTNATPNNPEDNKTATESELGLGGQSSVGNMPLR